MKAERFQVGQIVHYIPTDVYFKFLKYEVDGALVRIGPSIATVPVEDLRPLTKKERGL